MDEPNFCSSCLICAKLCVHPKARLKLFDCNLVPTTAKKARKTKKKKTNVGKGRFSFPECVSKFCQLFNLPPDDNFERDFSDFFKLTTLSAKCPVCDDCQNRITSISELMIQIETFQAELTKLQKSIEKDLSVQISSDSRSKCTLNNKMRVFINCDVKTRLFREKLREKLQISVNFNGARNLVDTVDAVNEIAISVPHTDTDAVLFEVERTDVETEEIENGLNLHCDFDDDYFDIKPDHDHEEDLNDSIDDNNSCWDDVQPNKVGVDPENKIRVKRKTHVYASLEVEGTTCTLTLSDLEKPVANDNSMQISVHEDKTDMAFAKKIQRPQAPSKSLTMRERGSCSNIRKILKCTFVDPVKGKCRVKVLDQDRLNAHVNRSHKNIPENISYECSLCPFATGTVNRLNRHRKQHAINKNASCETTTSIPDINCHDQIQQSLYQQNDEITSEIECDFDAGNQSSDSADVSLIAEINNPETEDAVRTLALNKLKEPNNSDVDLLELQSAEKMQVYDSTTKLKSTSQVKSGLGASVRVTKSDLSIRKRRLLTKVKLKRDKPLTKLVRDASKLFQCTYVDPVKGEGECRRKFLDQDYLDAHINRHHKNVPKNKAFKCSICPFATGLVKRLSRHREQHAGNTDIRKRDKPVTKHAKDTSKLLQCTHVDPIKGKCRWKLVDQDRLEAHINRHHKKIPTGKCFKCKLCSFATRTMQYLTLHNKIHAGIKDATCEVCGVSFRRESSLLQHKRRKHGEPFPVHCNICEKGFNNTYALKMHNYRNHVEEADYTHRCLVCDEGFYLKTHLNVHMVKHAERTFKCDECPKAYQTKHGLERHTQTIHTGIRPFACDLCSWKFFSQRRLDDHRSVHTNKRPFLCQECGFSSRLPGLLRAHLKVHANNHSLAEQGIEKASRLAKPRNRRLKSFETTVPPLLPTETEISTEMLVESIVQQVESEVVMK